MAKRKRKRTTYRSEFASLPPLQRKEQLLLLRRFLSLFSRRTAGGEDETQRPGPAARPPL
jgi:hypothetical protein